MGTETGPSSHKKQSLLGYSHISMAVVRQLHFLFCKQILLQQPHNTLPKFYIRFILMHLCLYSYFSQLSRNIMMRERDIPVISIMCSQYWMFPCSVFTSVLTRAVTKKNGKMPCLEGLKMGGGSHFSGAALSLGNLIPEFLLSKVWFPPFLLPQNNHFPKPAAHLSAPELKFSQFLLFHHHF